jgi:hypothetical protein
MFYISTFNFPRFFSSLKNKEKEKSHHLSLTTAGELFFPLPSLLPLVYMPMNNTRDINSMSEYKKEKAYQTVNSPRLK